MKKRNIFFAAMLLCAAALSANAQSWSLTGNTGTNQTTHFIGTRDPNMLTFKTNNVARMIIPSYGGIHIIDPGVSNSSSHPTLLYGEKSSPGPGIQINSFSTTNYSAAILGITAGNGAGIMGQASQAGAAGVYGYSGGSGFGVQAQSYYGTAVNANSYYSYGLYAATTYGYYAAYFNRSIYVNGGYYSSSDQKLKQNIEEFTSAMAIINKLHPKKYHYRQDGTYKLMKLPQEQQYGLLAQEVEKVLPGLVKDTKFETSLEAAPKKMGADGKFDLQPEVKAETIEFKAVNYVGMIPILIKGIQEQQHQLQQQQEQIEKLTALVDQLLSARLLPGNTGSIKNADVADIAFLSQNAPNPFNKTTTISYYVPQLASQVVITITGINGEVVKTYTISERGNGQLEIEAGQLAPGIYQYSLKVESKVVDTKKMVVLK